MRSFSILYRGFNVDFNGSATFNVYWDGMNIDAFTNYVESEADALVAAFEWIDEQIECGSY